MAEIGREVDYRPVETDGARRAAEHIAELLHDRHDARHADGADPRALPRPARASSSATACASFYEVYGDGEPTILLLPTWSLHPLARLEGADPLSGAPLPGRHLRRARQRQVRSPVGARGLRRAGVRRRRPGRHGRHRTPSGRCSSSLSRGAERSLLHRRRATPSGSPAWCSSRRPCRCPRRRRAAAPSRRSSTPRDTYEGWEKWNRHYWLEHYEDFVEFFISQIFTEPHSTKQREDAIGWALETDPETLAATQLAPRLTGRGQRARADGPDPLAGARGPRTRGRRPAPRLRARRSPR